jgi:hypothetical protein
LPALLSPGSVPPQQFLRAFRQRADLFPDNANLG